MKLQPYNTKSYPENPGVYRMLDSTDEIIYIGKAKNLKKRLTDYFDTSPKSPRIKLMIQNISQIEITSTKNEDEALILEQKLINKIKPKYNVIFRDDKSYPFIALSKHEFPKIFISREKNTKNIKDNLFGPYPKKDDAYNNLEHIQKMFKIRTCSDNEFSHRSRPCILHSIGKCSAPCVNKNDDNFKAEYKSSINQVKKLLTGQVTATIKSLTEDMKKYSDEFNFEKAAQIRDTINILTHIPNNQTIFSINQESILVFNYYKAEKFFVGHTRVVDGIPQEVFHQEIDDTMIDNSIEEILTKYIEQEVQTNGLLNIVTPIELPELFYPYHFKKISKNEKNWLNLVEDNLKIILNENVRVENRNKNTVDMLKTVFIPKITSIECIDISHFNGEATYGGKIRWTVNLDRKNGDFDKKSYRLSRFPGMVVDDIAHINQTVEKIYHTDNDIPSILIIDGDLPQMDAALEALQEKNIKKDYILMCSAKGSTRKKGVEIIHVHKNSHHLIHPEFLNGDILNLPKDNLVRLLVQHLQDTAHNFSNNARKKKMTKDRFHK